MHHRILRTSCTCIFDFYRIIRSCIGTREVVNFMLFQYFSPLQRVPYLVCQYVLSSKIWQRILSTSDRSKRRYEKEKIQIRKTFLKKRLHLSFSTGSSILCNFNLLSSPRQIPEIRYTWIRYNTASCGAWNTNSTPMLAGRLYRNLRHPLYNSRVVVEYRIECKH